MPDGQPPARGFAGLGRRQGVACLLAPLAGVMVATHWRVPDLQERVSRGTLAPGKAIETAAASTSGFLLVCLASALLACTLYNRFARERARGRNAGAREMAFLTSLGHRLTGPRLSSDRKSQD